ILGVTLLVSGVVFWRGAGNLQGHVRAGAQIIAEALSKPRPEVRADELATAREVLESLGTPTPLWIRPGSPAIGRSLSQLNLRALTGAIVLAIRRREGGLVFPGPDDILAEGDILALAGSSDALESASALLSPPSA